MDGKTNEWRNQAHEVIAEVAKNNSIVVSDMVVSALEIAGLGLDNYSVLGGVFTRAAKEGLIIKTDITQQSTRERSNSAKTVWRSLVYQPAGTTKEQNIVSGLLTAALDFNTETIRAASLVYAGGPMDLEQYQRAIKTFNEISDKYVFGNNYKHWWYHAIELAMARFREVSRHQIFKSVQYSRTPFVDDGGLKYCAANIYQELINDVAGKTGKDLKPFEDYIFENAPAELTKLDKELAKW